MKRSKLIPILKSLSKDEIKEFEKFLNSPFFGCKKFVLNFYKEVIKFYPGFNDEDIAKDKIFKSLYGHKKYNDALVRRIISDLIRLSEEYLMYKNFKNLEVFQNRCLLNELRNRNLTDQFRIRSESILRKIDSSETIGTDLLLESYFVKMEVKEFRTFLRDSKMHETYGQTVEVFIVYFLRLFYSYINHSYTFSAEIKSANELISAFSKTFYYRSFLKQLAKNQSRYSNYLKMVFYIFNIINNKEDRDSYFKLKKLLKRNPDYFTKNELKNIYVNIIRFYVYQNEKYDNNFLKELYDTYNFFLKNYFQPDSNTVLQLSFCRNYIYLCKQTGKSEQIKIFHKNYRGIFPPEYKDDLINLCEALYDFENKKFETSLNCASRVNIDKQTFKKDVKFLKLKNLYELGYFESAISEIDNFKHFLNSSDDLKTDELKKGKNFAVVLSKLIKLKLNSEKKYPEADLKILNNRLEKDKQFTEKNWLKEKVNEMKIS